MIDVNNLTISTSTSGTCTASAWSAWNPDPPIQTLTVSTTDLENLGVIAYDGPRCKNYEPPKESAEEKKAREELERSIRKYTPKKIVYNDPATVVFWQDGTKTVVKCAETEIFSEYYGFLAALAKKIFGTNSEICRVIRKNTQKPKEEKKPEPKPTPKAKNPSKNKKGTRKK